MQDSRKNFSHALQRTLISALLFALSMGAKAFAWGDDAHRATVRGAIAALPQDMGQFFQLNARAIAWHSTDPDYIPNRTDEQKADHFLDIDRYPVPPKEVPRSRKEAEARFGREKVIEYGVLPWAIEREYGRLLEALQNRNWEEVRLAAAHLSHFVADLYMPLHATANYDGQFTGNQGIHGRIEWELVPRYIGSRMIAANAPSLIENRIEWAFAEIQEDLALSASIMEADTAARKEAIIDTEAYYASLNRQLGPMLESRLKQAATAIASLYYSAWVEAGSPVMPPKRSLLVILDVPAKDPHIHEAEAQSRSLALDTEDAFAMIVTNSPKRLWRYTVEWNPAHALAEKPQLTYAGEKGYALEAAAPALRSMPGERRLIIVTNDPSLDDRAKSALAEIRNEGISVKLESTLRD